MENKDWRKLSFVVVALLFLSIGYLVGFGIGVKAGLTKAVDFGIYLFEKQGITIDFDRKALVDLISQYEVRW